jgi:hypothetical protein
LVIFDKVPRSRKPSLDEVASSPIPTHKTELPTFISPAIYHSLEI